MNPKVGQYSFLAGVILALVAGLLGGIMSAAMVTLILVILGLIVGFLNVTAKETTGFLVASVALIVAGSANLGAITLLGIGDILASMLGYIVVFVAPAAIIVALKAVVAAASTE
jgi:hypothetical protein